MAYITDYSMESLAGKWIMDKNLTCETDPIFKLQGIQWMIRKALKYATIYLDISIYTSEPDEPELSESVMHIDVLQTATGGLAGTTEKRRLDWSMQSHTDYIFGTVSSLSRLIDGLHDQNGSLRPVFEVQTQVTDERIGSFLRAEIQPDGTRNGGFLVPTDKDSGTVKHQKCWMHTFSRNEKSGWTVEQIWGFEMIHEHCYQTRRIVVADNKGHYEMARLVYTRQVCGT